MSWRGWASSLSEARRPNARRLWVVGHRSSRIPLALNRRICSVLLLLLWLAIAACAGSMFRTPDGELLERDPASDVGITFAKHGLWDRAEEAWSEGLEVDERNPSLFVIVKHLAVMRYQSPSTESSHWQIPILQIKFETRFIDGEIEGKRLIAINMRDVERADGFI